ncbi:kinase-like domain-containing protein [Desarmillaria tabescens]|uniref:Kinase-like domain-containing protein n=1 Tax=Armillaria tabescens TaxID=1929756 RepID=A0AA39NHZ1_ARMTA|nr:kinase-like domain-containing protein [Desarmillaria tabescens]KAK0465969.1 kinase-like domain-containing protein [Desarmillaria tabescens]
MQQCIENICYSHELSHAFASLTGPDAAQMLDLFFHLINDRVLIVKFYNLKLHQRCCRLLRELACNSKLLPRKFLIVPEGHENQVFSEGGNARIYRARYNGTNVVLKVLRFWVDDFRENQSLLRKRFCQEAFLWYTTRHKNVLPVLGVDEVSFSPHLSIVLPYRSHGSLMKFRQQAGPERLDCERLLADVAEGLTYLHDTGVVHGDLYGSNVLIDDEYHAQIADFGLAALSVITRSAPRSGSGIPGHKAPELLACGDVDDEDMVVSKASDVYAFACLCYELYQGKGPFSGTAFGALLIQLENGVRPARPMRGTSDGVVISLDVPDRVWSWVEKCWAQGKHDRPTMAAVASGMRERHGI